MVSPPLPEITPWKSSAPLVTVRDLVPSTTEPPAPPETPWTEAPEVVPEMSKVPSLTT